MGITPDWTAFKSKAKSIVKTGKSTTSNKSLSVSLESIEADVESRWNESDSINELIDADAVLKQEHIWKSDRSRRMAALLDHDDGSGDLPVFLDVPPDFDITPPIEGISDEKEIEKISEEVSLENMPIFRDKEGKIIPQEEWLAAQSRKRGGFLYEKEKKQQKAEPVAWGKGIKQLNDQQKQAEEDQKIIEGPTTRYEISDEADFEIQREMRWDDPMRGYVDGGGVKASNIQNVSKPQFVAPPNRYGIQAGVRWDGVVRGNGFEGRLLKSETKRNEQEKEWYKGQAIEEE